MRSLFVFLALSVAGPAIACPPPPPMTDKLTLLTPNTTTIPADGGLLVRRDSIMQGTPDDDGAWTVRARGGAAVAVDIEPLSSRIERWTFKTAADRELEIVNRAGKVVAVVTQRAAREPRLEAPRPNGVTSTLAAQQTPVPGIPGATVVVQLARKPPAGARYLIATLDDAADMAVAAFDATPGTPRFESTTHGGKACGGWVSTPLAIGQRVSLSWVDATGRRSPAARVVVARAR